MGAFAPHEISFLTGGAFPVLAKELLGRDLQLERGLVNCVQSQIVRPGDPVLKVAAAGAIDLEAVQYVSLLE